MAASPAPLTLVTHSRHDVSLLDADPELGDWIDPSCRDAARRATRVPVTDLEAGPFDPAEVLGHFQGGFGALILSGLVTREVSIGRNPVLRLLGPGDLFLDEAPPADTIEPSDSWSASVATRVAVLDDHLLLAVRRWPRLARGVCSRLQQCHDTTLLQLVVSHQPRVEDRIAVLFGLLAARWGRMTPDGVVVPIALTHEAIGRMVGARRPTVTLALRGLAEQGRLQRDGKCGRWLLGPDLAPTAPVRPLAGGQLPRTVPA